MPQLTNPSKTTNAPSATNIYDAFRSFLSDVEETGIKHLGLTELMNYASDRPRELGYDMSNNYGPGKTLRHLLLAGELQREHPALASSLLNGHEYVTNVLQGQDPEVRDRDLFNNKLGRELGKMAQSREELERLALGALSHANYARDPRVQMAQGFSDQSQPIPGTADAHFAEGFNQ